MPAGACKGSRTLQALLSLNAQKLLATCRTVTMGEWWWWGSYSRPLSPSHPATVSGALALVPFLGALAVVVAAAALFAGLA